ncbi:uncharacterized protein PHALS_03261 [Plasmopara halstedii]|uniref:Uncharacterized protein n=1 Tax=Plasmopara halstedii TaxID=4781 RepID=A0A0P1AX97_PLAHL|nr:uncharacterized protein PHALS_03261 [Plasmopara halstedii]CEG46654.1 hypothetical protein PHALS_03261 [Plasmopara halstedii]|eukprot:XP_024583023.1 hypothetical protein PHALS_03261 [Plasmopara halstedii]
MSTWWCVAEEAAFKAVKSHMANSNGLQTLIVFESRQYLSDREEPKSQFQRENMIWSYLGYTIWG